MIRHQEYLDRRERQMSITYHDNMYVPPDQEDIQLLALQQALLMLKNLYQDKFEVIIGFYYGNYKTIKAYAVTYGISRQAMSKKLHKTLEGKHKHYDYDERIHDRLIWQLRSG